MSGNKKNLSGLAMIKKTENDNSIRTVFMSETGLKYFDFEFFKNDSLRIHYVMDALNRKGLIRLITTDLGLILKRKLNDKTVSYNFPVKSKGGVIIKEKQQGRSYYHFTEGHLPPSQISHRKWLTPAMDIGILYNAEQIPSNIIFTHGIINLRMELILITE